MIKIGALRDFETETDSVYLVQKGQINTLAGYIKSEYAVCICPKTSFYVDKNNDLICDEKNCIMEEYDTFETAQKRYLELAKIDNVKLKVQEWSAKDWKS